MSLCLKLSSSGYTKEAKGLETKHGMARNGLLKQPCLIAMLDGMYKLHFISARWLHMLSAAHAVGCTCRWLHMPSAEHAVG